MDEDFKYLFTSIKLGNTTIPNRIYSPAHSTRFGHDGLVTKKMVAYHRERAKGGVGLIITEAIAVHPTSLARFGMIHNWDDRVIPGLRELAGAVHQYGSKIFGQLNHNGRGMLSFYSGKPLLAPSPIPDSLMREVPKEMELEEIHEVISSFGQAARRLKEAGFDGVEIQGAHGYLVHQFMSPCSNKRKDQYGGSLENRLRFPFEVIAGVRKSVGEDFVVGIRISGDEFTPQGLTLEDMIKISKELEGSGQIDFLNVSVGNYDSCQLITPPWYIPIGSFVYLAAKIKEAVGIPVMCVNRINDPVLAEKILADHQADLIGMTRALIADPELPNKAKEGRLDEIRNCIGCNQMCLGVAPPTTPYLSCTVNPVVGEEEEAGILKPASVKKTVIIIGGGPAGLEVARIAAKRGHKVTIYEKEEELGGQVALFAEEPNRIDFADIIRFLTVQLKKLGVEVRTKTYGAPETVIELNPDVVVVATGSEPNIPQIPGADKDTVVTTWEVLKHEREIGKRVLIIAEGEGHQRPVSIAEFLADQGKDVEVVSTLPVVGMDIELGTLRIQYQRLSDKGVVLTPSTKVVEIFRGEVKVRNLYTNSERRIPVDTVVDASESRSVNDLYFSLKGKVRELYQVGDCVAPRRLNDAIYAGYHLGISL